MPTFPDIQAKTFESFKVEFLTKLRHYLNNLKAENIISVDPAVISAALVLGVTTGLVTQTGADTFEKRTITTNKDYITITDGDGVSDDPTIDIEYADATHDGVLKQADWSTFNGKADYNTVSGSFTTDDGKTVTVTNGMISNIT